MLCISSIMSMVVEKNPVTEAAADLTGAKYGKWGGDIFIQTASV